jgi:hypothetical protein
VSAARLQTCWLLLRGIATDAAAYSTALRIFDDFALAEVSLYKDVLQARGVAHGL